MAQLQWRDVAAPDFSGSMQGINAASQMISNALASARSGVAEFEKIQDDKLNSNIMAELATMQNTGDAARIPSLLAGVDASRLDPATLAMVMSRKGQLTQQELADINLRDTRFNSDRNMDWTKMLDGAGPEAAALNEALTSGDPAKIAAARSAFTGKLSGAPVDKLLSLYSNTAGLERDILGNTSARQRIAFDAEDQAWSREDRKFAETADELYGQMRAGAITGDDFLANLNQQFSSGKISGRAYAAVLGKAGLSGFDSGLGGYAAPGLEGMGGGGSAGADALRVITGGGSGNLGIGSVPANIQTLGQAVQFGKSLNNRGQESSAMGMFQITQSTLAEFAPKAFGSGWQSQRFDDPRVQDAVAKKIFEHARSQKNPAEALRGRWVSLSPQEAAQVVRMPWEQARDIISRKESSSSASALIAQAAGQAVDNAQRGAAFVETNAGDNLALKFNELAGSQETPAQVARRMAKENPGLNAAWLEGQILKLQSDVAGANGSRKKVNAAMAGQAILDNSGAQSAREFWGRLVPDSIASNTIGEDQVVDYDAARNALYGYATGRMDDRIAVNEALVATAQVQQNAKAMRDQALAKYQAKVRAAQARGIRNPNLSAELADLAMAEQALQDASGQPSGGLPGVVENPEQPIVVNRPVQRQAPAVAAPARNQAPPPKNSAAARRSRATEMLGNALMNINPVYWAGRLIDGR